MHAAVVVAQREPKPVNVGGQPVGIAAAGTDIWVSGGSGGNAVRVDANTRQVTANLVTANVRMPSGASTLLPVGNLIWIGLQNGSIVSLDPATGALSGAAIKVASDVDALVSTPNGLWASTCGGTAALVDIGARRVVRRVRLPGRGSGIAYAGGRVWVTVYDARYVLALDPMKGTLLAAVHAGVQPSDSLVVGSRPSGSATSSRARWYRSLPSTV